MRTPQAREQTKLKEIGNTMYLCMYVFMPHTTSITKQKYKYSTFTCIHITFTGEAQKCILKPTVE
jgi:hypothetical protein